MGTQFWWFFDAAAAAILLVLIYLSGKKGFSRALIPAAGFILSAVLAAAVSAPAAELIYENTVSGGNVVKIARVLESINLPQKTKNLLSGLGYGSAADEEKIAAVFSSGGDISAALYEYISSAAPDEAEIDPAELDAQLSDGLAEIMSTALSKELTGFVSEAAAEKIRSGGISGFSEAIRLLHSEGAVPAGEYIEENYTSAASQNIVKVICFIIIVFALMAAVSVLIRGIPHRIRPAGELLEPILGGVLGAAEGILMIFITAAAARVLAVLGNDGMMLFNSEAIDETIFFRHIYNWAMKL